LGHDFGDVGVHTDAEASDLAASVNAEAFTTGSDMYFQAGRHDPESHDGRRLLTHELTHVVQQRSTPQIAQRRRAVDPSSQATDPRPCTTALILEAEQPGLLANVHGIYPTSPSELFLTSTSFASRSDRCITMW
jgi:hypothetical protein